MRVRMKRSFPELLKDDMELLINLTYDTITFQWTETEGGYWDDIYETWIGGEEKIKELETKGMGKVVSHKEDEMEYEFGRVSVGECIVRFPVSFKIEELSDKNNMRFIFKGQKWKPDSKFGVGEYFNDVMYSKLLKGIKAVD